MVTANTDIYTYVHTLSLHDALPIFGQQSHNAGIRNAGIGMPRNSTKTIHETTATQTASTREIVRRASRSPRVAIMRATSAAGWRPARRRTRIKQAMLKNTAGHARGRGSESGRAAWRERGWTAG